MSLLGAFSLDRTLLNIGAKWLGELKEKSPNPILSQQPGGKAGTTGMVDHNWKGLKPWEKRS